MYYLTSLTSPHVEMTWHWKLPVIFHHILVFVNIEVNRTGRCRWRRIKLNGWTRAKDQVEAVRQCQSPLTTSCLIFYRWWNRSKCLLSKDGNSSATATVGPIVHQLFTFRPDPIISFLCIAIKRMSLLVNEKSIAKLPLSRQDQEKEETKRQYCCC